MKSYSFICDSPVEAEAKVSEIMVSGFIPTLGVVFSSISIDYLSIRDKLDSKGIQVYGVTSAGEISNGEVAELSVSIRGFFGEDRSLTFAGTVPQGAKVKFCILPGIDVIEKTISETRELRDTVPKADALLLFFCKARHVALGPIIEEEVRKLQELWGALLTGFLLMVKLEGWEERPATSIMKLVSWSY